MKAKKTRGRPTKFSAEIAEKLCKLIREGHFRVWVAKKIKVDPATIWRWEEAHPEFRKALKRAEEQRKEVILERIIEAGVVKKVSTFEKTIGDWKANAWLLERMYPKEFSLHNRVELEHIGPEKLREEVKRYGLDKVLTGEDLDEELARLEAQGNVPGSDTQH